MLTLNLNLLYTVVNILVLFLLLRKFLYKPVMNIIAQRQKQVDDALNAAETSKQEAAAALNDAQAKLRNVDAEAVARRTAYEQQAEKDKQQLLADAQKQADAILALQLRRLAALERQKIMDEYTELKARVDDLNDILAKPERQRAIISTELGEIVDKFGDERRTRILPFDGEMSMEDLIPEEDVVVTITRDGFAKRTRTDNYRSQKRGGKGVRGTQLRGDDVVEHFFVTTTHNWLLFFTNLGRVYRAKAYEIPEGGRDAKGQHVANLLAFQPDEHIAQVLAIRTYEDADFLVLATKRGLVKKTPLSLYNSPAVSSPSTCARTRTASPTSWSPRRPSWPTRTSSSSRATARPCASPPPTTSCAPWAAPRPACAA